MASKTKKIVKCYKRKKRKSPKCEDISKKCIWIKGKKCVSIKSFRKKKDIKKYSSRLNFNLKRSIDKTYNAQAVAKALGIKSDLPYVRQCSLIMDFLKKHKKNNPIIKELLNKSLKQNQICNILVDVLYNLLQPKKFPFKAPITISQDKYKELIEKYQKRTLKSRDRQILNEALNIKYCFCIKKLYLKFLFNNHFLGKKNKVSEYAICMSSIYKKRKIKPPKKISRKCVTKYDWYRNT